MQNVYQRSAKCVRVQKWERLHLMVEFRVAL